LNGTVKNTSYINVTWSNSMSETDIISNTVDIIMSLDPVGLSKDEKALEAVIGHYRNTRAREGEDGKIKKTKATKAPGPTVSLVDIVKKMTEGKVEVKPTGLVRRI
jgi:hypothetical protein